MWRGRVAKWKARDQSNSCKITQFRRHQRDEDTEYALPLRSSFTEKCGGHVGKPLQKSRGNHTQAALDGDENRNTL